MIAKKSKAVSFSHIAKHSFHFTFFTQMTNTHFLNANILLYEKFYADDNKFCEINGKQVNTNYSGTLQSFLRLFNIELNPII